jgi:hypothetical protein
MQAARRRAVLISRAGSAGGPKPGRAGFYLELGAAFWRTRAKIASRSNVRLVCFGMMSSERRALGLHRRPAPTSTFDCPTNRNASEEQPITAANTFGSRFRHDFTRIPAHAPRRDSKAEITPNLRAEKSAAFSPVSFFRQHDQAGGFPATDTATSQDKKTIGNAETRASTSAATSSLHVPPIDFVLAKPAPVRSDLKRHPSKTTFDVPTIDGSVVIDTTSSSWRFEPTTIHAKGTTRIVYNTEDHYPAPVPPDDMGPLTHVTDKNWTSIVDDLEGNADGIFKFWASYKAEDDHEQYHVDDYKQELESAAETIGTEIAMLSVSGTKSADFAAKHLRQDANNIVANAHDDAEEHMRARGDSPGDPPYTAQVEAVSALVKRIEEFARSNGWKK